MKGQVELLVIGVWRRTTIWPSSGPLAVNDGHEKRLNSRAGKAASGQDGKGLEIKVGRPRENQRRTDSHAEKARALADGALVWGVVVPSRACLC